VSEQYVSSEIPCLSGLNHHDHANAADEDTDGEIYKTLSVPFR